MQAVWNDVVIADSDDTVVVEGNHYFPIESIKKEYFEKTDFTSFCGLERNGQLLFSYNKWQNQQRLCMVL